MVTVVFADLAGSSELASRLDPESLREVLAAFHGMVTDVITGLDGRAEAFIGDAVLGVFGVPTVHDDDSQRGVRAGLEIVDRARRLGPALGLAFPVEVRVGVKTGQVAVGAATDRNLVVGAEVNLGARLQQAALPGEVLVGDTTHDLVGQRAEFGPMRTIEAKGFDAAVSAWPALRMSGGAGSSAIRMIDRQQELSLLADTFERMRERGRAHLVTLVGEPGIGKSRVAAEFVSSLPGDVTVLSGRSSPFEERVTFWPLAQMLYRLLDLERGADPDETRERLRGLVEAWGGRAEPEATIRQLGYLIGLGEESRQEDRSHETEVRRGVLAMIEGLVTRGPVVLVFENLHEADPLLFDLLEQLMKDARRLPLLVVCVARWEFLQTRANWAGGIADAVTLWVEPLSEPDAMELAMAAAGLDADEARRVAQHAGGNPYFVIEVAAMLRREERDLPPRGAAADPRLLPATVQAVVAARIDQLSPEAKELVRRAAVFPRGRFDVDELSLLAEPRRGILAEAEEDELLVRDEDRRGAWRFRSQVIRDVAYDSLAKRERQRLHLRVANKLSGSGDAERFPRTIAYHLEQAARASLDLDPNDRALAQRAADALAHAGDLARQRVESRSAADMYERALALSAAEAEWGEREAWILSMIGETRYWVGEFAQAEGAFWRALEVAGGGSDRVTAHACRFLGDMAVTIHGDTVGATGLFERAIDAARRIGDPYVLSRALLMAAWVPFWQHDLAKAEGLFREALSVARTREIRDHWAEARALVGISAIVSETGDEAEALGVAQEALAIGREGDQAFTSAVAHESVAASLRGLLQLDEALEHGDAAIATLREVGARWELASALGDRGAIHRLGGKLEASEGDLREAFALCRDLHERALVTWTAAELAWVLAMRGDPEAARLVLSEPAARASEGEPTSAASLRRAEAVIALVDGDLEAARLASIQAVELSRGPTGAVNPLAAQVWWTGRLFGDVWVGGPVALAEARATLERNGWRQALMEPEQVAHLLS